MRRSRKSVVTLAAALAGVLAMAGVAAAAHGRSASRPSERVHRHAPTVPSIAPLIGSGGSGAIGGTGGSGLTTTTEIEHAKPEPRDDNGQAASGHDVNDVNDAVAHDATDDRGDDATTTSFSIDTSTTSSHTIEYRAYDSQGRMASVSRTVTVAAQ